MISCLFGESEVTGNVCIYHIRMYHDGILKLTSSLEHHGMYSKLKTEALPCKEKVDLRSWQYYVKYILEHPIGSFDRSRPITKTKTDEKTVEISWCREVIHVDV